MNFVKVESVIQVGNHIIVNGKEYDTDVMTLSEWIHANYFIDDINKILNQSS